MRKLFTILTSVLFILTLAVVPVMAGGYSGGFGSYDINTFDMGGGIDGAFKQIPNGFAGGVSAGGGIAGAEAGGFIINGSVEGDITSNAGGFANTYTYNLHKGDVFDSNAPDKFIGVGSRSDAFASTGASFKIKVDPGFGFGETDASMFGLAGQGTLNVSGVGSSPLEGWETDGHTGGIAAQGSVGGFVGGGYALSGPDYWSWCQRDNVNSKAGAGAGAQVDMAGFSISESYRFMNDNGNYHTEGMGTRVAAGTEITSNGYDYDWDKGLSESGAYVCGGFVAVGGAKACTVQSLPSGMASASATGFYIGAGKLDGSYSGSANGYTATSMTTISGMNGSMSSSAAGMSINSSPGTGGGQPD